MKRLLILALVLSIAVGAMAEDKVGLFRTVDGEYENFLPMEEIIPGNTIDLYVTLHNATRPTIGGYEVGIDLPAELVVMGLDIYSGINIGDGGNMLVGYQYPQLAALSDIFVLGTMHCVLNGIPTSATYLTMHGANPPSVPGHDGPVYADGAVPEILVPCGYVGVDAEVFLFGGSVAAVETNWSGVKSLFE